MGRPSRGMVTSPCCMLQENCEQLVADVAQQLFEAWQQRQCPVDCILAALAAALLDCAATCPPGQDALLAAAAKHLGSTAEQQQVGWAWALCFHLGSLSTWVLQPALQNGCYSLPYQDRTPCRRRQPSAWAALRSSSRRAGLAYCAGMVTTYTSEHAAPLTAAGKHLGSTGKEHAGLG